MIKLVVIYSTLDSPKILKAGRCRIKALETARVFDICQAVEDLLLKYYPEEQSEVHFLIDSKTGLDMYSQKYSDKSFKQVKMDIARLNTSDKATSIDSKKTKYWSNLF